MSTTAETPASLGLGPLFKTDQHGRIFVPLTGTGWTSAEWIARSDAGVFGLTKWARDVLTRPDYDAKHRLEPGKQYVVALMFGKTEFPVDADRSTANLQARGERDYGQSDDLRGELALLLREAISDEQLELWGIRYIAVLHEPIIDSIGCPRVLAVDLDVDRTVVAFCGPPFGHWFDDGAFAVPVSQ
jgi:hypothetical protein